MKNFEFVFFLYLVITRLRRNKDALMSFVVPPPPPSTSLIPKGVLNVYVGKSSFHFYDAQGIKHERLPAWDWRALPKFCPESAGLRQSMNVDQLLVWWSLYNKRHVLISGQAGSGKSYLLEDFVRSARTTGMVLEVTAPTAIAAMNVGGSTVHRRLALGLADQSAGELIARIKAQRYKHLRTWRFLEKTDVLIIDEISMLTPTLFSKLDVLFRMARQSSDPFGGVLLIMCGDFTQLPPVVKRTASAYVDPASPSPPEARFVIDTEVWRSMDIVRLNLLRSYRQVDGDPLVQILREVRVGRLSPESLQLLHSRVQADASISTRTAPSEDQKEQSYVIRPIKMFSYKKLVERCNQAALKRFEEKNVKLHRFAPSFRVIRYDPSKPCHPTEYKKAQSMCEPKKWPLLFREFPVSFVHLGVGCQVMMRCNDLVEHGICNGTMGVVTAVASPHIAVLFKGMTEPLNVPRAVFSTRITQTCSVAMTQFPLNLAYATTIHKSQGLTLDSAEVDAQNCFEAGQLYTSLSRVRKLENLRLIRFSESSLKANQRAVEFETSAESQIPHLPENQARRCRNREPDEERQPDSKRQRQDRMST